MRTMDNLQLFRSLAKVAPLEPIDDADHYFKACELQEEYRNSEDPVLKLYFQALTLFVEAYEGGFRVS